MNLRGRLNRLERTAGRELRHGTPAIDTASRYAADVEARRAKIAEVTLDDPMPVGPESIHPRDRLLWTTLDRFLKACRRRREQAR